MSRSSKNINWAEMMEKFEIYNGKIVDFCNENNIIPQQLYRRRKKLDKSSIQTFHAIDVSRPAAIDNPNEEIRIEIGNTRIYIPKGDKSTLMYILKELII